MPAHPSLSIAGLLMTLPMTGAHGDAIAGQIKAALKGNERRADAAGLDVASILIRQAKAVARRAMLPEPLAGWTASHAESTIVGNALLGGGVTLSRTYRTRSQSVEIALIAESPVMQGLGALMSSGIISDSDLTPMIIDGRRVTYRRSENSYTTLVGDAVVSVKGQPADDASLRAYLGAVRSAPLETAATG